MKTDDEMPAAPAVSKLLQAGQRPESAISIGPYDADPQTVERFKDQLKAAESKYGLLLKDLAHHNGVTLNGHGVAVSREGRKVALELQDLVHTIERFVPPNVSELGDRLLKECKTLEPELEELLADPDLEEDEPDVQLMNLLNTKPHGAEQLVED